MARLDGKVVVITGAGGGMGRDAAVLFTEEGARVCVDVGDAHLGALLAEEERSLATHSAAGAGDHGHLSVQSSHLCRHVNVLDL